MANTDPLLAAAKADMGTAFRQVLAQGADPAAFVYFVTAGPSGTASGALHKVADIAERFTEGPEAGLGLWFRTAVPRGHVRVVTVNGSHVTPYFLPLDFAPGPGQTLN